MVVGRLVCLVFLVLLGWSTSKYDDLNSLGELLKMSLVVTIPALYFLPTYESWAAEHENFLSNSMLNIFLGWTFVGWVAAYVWALKKPDTVSVQVPSQGFKETKACKFCGEEVLRVAVKCKHCSSDLS